MDVLSRFAKKVEVTDGCWNWKGAHFGGPRGGYARFAYKHGRSVYAHRFAYELMRGPIPHGLVIDHLCRNRRCINPDHLQVVTNQENILRGVGLAAANSLKQFCPNGHELHGPNLAKYQLRVGKRVCRICSNARLKAKRSK